jgi:malate dehydrogenase (oxaloacetate-decarboxylating)(NADP+)
MSSDRFSEEEVLAYHEEDPPGKIGVHATKPTSTQRDLSIAYSPGVAVPCRRIDEDPADVFRYTSRGNLVACVSDGSAVLGLGDIGPTASKPVMEGKAVLFKEFADVDVFDLELDVDDPEAFIEAVRSLEPTFGGVNIEDVKAPDCFEVESALKEQMDIPVFHDDQHGTAVITGAGLINALELAGKDLGDVDLVFSGAGASAVACARFFTHLGVDRDRVTMVDSGGVIHPGRDDVAAYKEEWARDTDARTLGQALENADVLVGLSVGGLVDADMVRSMADDPVVFALANPDPEIPYDEAKEARPDAIVATGRSDHPNQVNNVLGFPFIFRGALDARARNVNRDMMEAAARALATLAREDVPDEVLRAYDRESLQFGREYILPKPVDHRVLLRVAPAVARAAMETGCARREIDLATYTAELEARLGKEREMMRIIMNKAKRDPRRVVFPEGHEDKILRAAQILQDEGVAKPVLLGDRDEVRSRIEGLGLDVEPEVVDPATLDDLDAFAQDLFELRKRKGVTEAEARELVETNRNYLGSLMVRRGEADALVTGLNQYYPDALRPALQVIGAREDVDRVVGLYMMTLKRKVFFFADATVNIDPDAEVLAEIALETARVARSFDVEPRVAMLSFSDFGSTKHPDARKVAEAARLVKEEDPDLEVDGEMQADTAVVEEMLEETYDFSDLDGPANVLVFPDLGAANISYKLLQRLADAEATGPILSGLRKPAHVLQRGDDVDDIVNMAAIAVHEAQRREKERP